MSHDSTTSPQPGSVEGWNGPYRSYDLIKEIAVALAAVAALALLLATLFGSARREAVTFAEWSTADPSGFLSTTLDELAGSSGTATYGPPYNATADAGQALFGLSPQRLIGVRIPVDATQDMVLRPLGRLAGMDTPLASALAVYAAADPATRQGWLDEYRTALPEATIRAGGVVELPARDFGPVAPMMGAMLGMAQSGAIDGALIDDRDGTPGFFVLDYTRSLLYLADGDYFAGLGADAGLAGDQWGMAATLGNWPGQPWLIPVSFWYQIPPGSTSGNGDILVLSIVGLLGLALILLPFIPGLRTLPLKLGIHRLVWRHHYRDAEEE